jgi:signal transduction histidine kinase/response regulator RpfG family c-di-GMP phosphodiesterase
VKKKPVTPAGPNLNEVRLRAEVDRQRSEVEKLRRINAELERSRRVADPAQKAEPTPAATEPAAAEVELLRQQVAELENTRERLSKLYFSQVEDNRQRARKLHHLLGVVSQINSTLDVDPLLDHIVKAIQQSLGFRIVLLRIRETGSPILKARASAGLSEESMTDLATQEIVVEDFQSWLREEFRVSRSYFISHKQSFSKVLPVGFVADLGERAEWEWHQDDVLLVPLFDRAGELLGYFSVDDPVDRLIPSQEVIELLEIFGSHAVVAIENARLYQAVEQRNRQLEEAGHRMQELNALKSNFVSTVSHELRTPLTAIRAYVDALHGAQGRIEPDQLRRFLEVIDEESQRLARLIESVLDLSRFESGAVRGQRQPVDIAEVVRETQRMLEPLAQTAQVALKLAEPQADTLVDADRDQMRQLVLHLGTNAVKFTPQGGEVRFEVGTDGDQVLLVVEDTGIGIAESELERIFERFYQVDSSLARRFGGSGLGLAICKAIVDWHGGRIRAESTPGHGSSFVVQLPRHARAGVIVRAGADMDESTADVLRMAVEMVSDVMGANVVSLMGLNARGELQIEAAKGLEQRLLDDVRIPIGQGVAGWVAQQRRPVCVSRPGEASEVSPSGRRQYRSGTFLSVPLESESGVLGVLNVTDPVSRRTFAAEDCHLLLTLATRVSAAWQQARRQAAGPPGEETAADTLRNMLVALQARPHRSTNRIHLANAIARRLGLSEAETGLIGYVASIYDVGMARLGQDMLSSARGETAPVSATAVAGTLEAVGAMRDMILARHEWWDGSGYPRGLREAGIPMGARILAVVDAFESMTSGRAHWPPRGGLEALQEIRDLAGSQFDPGVVEALMLALPEAELDDDVATGMQAGPQCTPARR